MDIYNSNVKNIKRTKGVVKCKCGCIRIDAKVCYDDGEGFGNWLELHCKKCGKCLYYNGA